MRAWLAAGAAAMLLAGCGRDAAEARARAAAERVRQTLTDDSERALGQRVPLEQVRAAQQALSVLHEYYGDIDGRLDTVRRESGVVRPGSGAPTQLVAWRRGARSP